MCLHGNGETHFSIAVHLNLGKMRAILTVTNIIPSHPLTGILSSLSGHLHHAHGAAKINLEPLVPSVMLRGPGSYPRSTFPEVESGVGWTVISVPA